LHTGERPLFHLSSEPLVPYLESFGLTPHQINQGDTHAEVYAVLQTLDTDLFETFEDLRMFCRYMNHTAETKSRLPAHGLVHSMVAIQYRLLRLRFLSGTLDETVRLGLLAFSSTIFLKWRHVTLRYGYLREAYRNSLLHLLQTQGIPSTLMLWFLVAGSVSVFAGEKTDAKITSLLQSSLEKSRVKTRDDLETILDAVVWIDFIQMDKTVCNTSLSP
jgi:hypothetical protein